MTAMYAIYSYLFYSPRYEQTMGASPQGITLFKVDILLLIPLAAIKGKLAASRVIPRQPHSRVRFCRQHGTSMTFALRTTTLIITKGVILQV